MTSSADQFRRGTLTLVTQFLTSAIFFYSFPNELKPKIAKIQICEREEITKWYFQLLRLLYCGRSFNPNYLRSLHLLCHFLAFSRCKINFIPSKHAKYHQIDAKSTRKKIISVVMAELNYCNFWSIKGRVVRREQISSIAIELTFIQPQIKKGSINDYIWNKHVDFYLCYGCVVFTFGKIACLLNLT